MEGSLTASSIVPAAAASQPIWRHRLMLLLLVAVNLLAIPGIWLLTYLGLGWRWVSVGYDPLAIVYGSLMVSQILILGLWASLSEPRSPWRWIGLVGLCGLVAIFVSLAFEPTFVWWFMGQRFGITWGVVFWNSYVTFMLVLSACVAFFIAADIVMWPLRRVLGCRVALEGHAPATPAARGFGLTELFWWVGMAAAACWLLRALLENVLANDLAIVLLILVCVIPVGLPAAAAAMVSRSRRLLLVAALAWAVIYALVLAGIFWVFTEINSPPQNAIVSYVVYFPPDLLCLAIAVATLATYLNGLALRYCGIRSYWSMPTMQLHKEKNQASPRGASVAD